MRVVPIISLSINMILLSFPPAVDVPVSTIPAVSDRMVVDPYLMDSLMPQYSFAGEVPVMGLHKFISSYKSGKNWSMRTCK